jgi:hypothetical protein
MVSRNTGAQGAVLSAATAETQCTPTMPGRHSSISSSSNTALAADTILATGADTTERRM